MSSIADFTSTKNIFTFELIDGFIAILKDFDPDQLLRTLTNFQQYEEQLNITINNEQFQSVLDVFTSIKTAVNRIEKNKALSILKIFSNTSNSFEFSQFQLRIIQGRSEVHLLHLLEIAIFTKKQQFLAKNG